MTEKPKNAVIYTRVSTVDQVKNGYGLETQLEKCRLLAKLNDCTVVEEVSDKGISGTKDGTERPGLARVIELAASKQINVVIIYSISRLGRTTELVIDVFKQLESHDIDVICHKESFDTSTGTGRFIFRLFASLAELEKDNIVERLSEGKHTRSKADGEIGGHVPYGYRRIIHKQPSTIAIDGTEAGIVKEIFDLYDNEKLSMWKIAGALNENEIASPRGKKWYASSVKVILDNRDKYQGGLRGDSQETWPKIL